MSNERVQPELTREQAIRVLQYWICRRIEEVAVQNKKWSDELTQWATCISHGHAHEHCCFCGCKCAPGCCCKEKDGDGVTSHWQEPPIPLVLGYLGEVASDWENVGNPGQEVESIFMAALGYAMNVGFPANYRTCEKGHQPPHVYNTIFPKTPRKPPPKR